MPAFEVEVLVVTFFLLFHASGAGFKYFLWLQQINPLFVCWVTGYQVCVFLGGPERIHELSITPESNQSEIWL